MEESGQRRVAPHGAAILHRTALDPGDVARNGARNSVSECFCNAPAVASARARRRTVRRMRGVRLRAAPRVGYARGGSATSTATCSGWPT